MADGNIRVFPIWEMVEVKVLIENGLVKEQELNSTTGIGKYYLSLTGIKFGREAEEVIYNGMANKRCYN